MTQYLFDTYVDHIKVMKSSLVDGRKSYESKMFKTHHPQVAIESVALLFGALSVLNIADNDYNSSFDTFIFQKFEFPEQRNVMRVRDASTKNLRFVWTDNGKIQFSSKTLDESQFRIWLKAMTEIFKFLGLDSHLEGK